MSTEAGARALMFGGEDVSNQLLDDTWARIGDGWVPLSSALQPTARTNHAMTYAASLPGSAARTIMFGGRTPVGYETDTWGFNDSWSVEQVGAQRPLGREQHVDGLR